MSIDVNSPDATPDSLHTKRASKLPIAIFGVIVFVFLIMIALIASQKSNNHASNERQTTPDSNNSGKLADAFLPDISGIIPETKDEVLLPPQESAQPVDLNAPPSPPSSRTLEILTPPDLDGQGVAPSGGQVDAELERYRNARSQLFTQAISAPTTPNIGSLPIKTNISTSGGNATRQQLNDVRARLAQQTSENPSDGYAARLALAQRKVEAMGSPSNSNPATSGLDPLMPIGTSGAGGGLADYEAYGGNANRWNLGTQVQELPSPYTLRAGFVIPASLIRGINSDRPGQVIGQVRHNVYDSASGQYLLIPQGTRLVGSYESQVAYGQSRVLIAWQRLIFPDGRALDLGAMPGADIAGYAGLTDKANNHYIRTFGSALLMSMVIAGVDLSQDSDGTGDRQRASDAMSEALGQQLGQVMAQMISKNLNVSPTLEIRPGFLFNITVTKDLVFDKPYK